MEFKRVTIDTSKSVFTLHDTHDRPNLRRNLSRSQFEVFFVKQSSTEAVLEAGGGSHHCESFARRDRAYGEVDRAPQYVKLFLPRMSRERYKTKRFPVSLVYIAGSEVVGVFDWFENIAELSDPVPQSGERTPFRWS